MVEDGLARRTLKPWLMGMVLVSNSGRDGPPCLFAVTLAAGVDSLLTARPRSNQPHVHVCCSPPPPPGSVSLSFAAGDQARATAAPCGLACGLRPVPPANSGLSSRA